MVFKYIRFFILLALINISTFLYGQPNANIGWVPNTTLCPNGSVELDIFGTVGDDSIIIVWGNGDPYKWLDTVEPMSYMHTYEDAGVFTLEVIAYDDPITDTARVQITVIDFSADFTKDVQDSICWNINGNLVNVTDQTDDLGMQYSRAWHFGDGAIDTFPDMSYNYLQSGRHDLTLIASVLDNSSWPWLECYDTITKPITIYQNSNLIQEMQWTEGCPCNMLEFQASGNAIEWQWEMGDQEASHTGSSITHFFSEPGSFTVVLTAQDAEGCSARKYLNIDVCNADTTFASKADANWYFGASDGDCPNTNNFSSISFEEISGGFQATASTSKGQMHSSEAASTVSHPETGEVLFYTNGVEVFDTTGAVMSNGSGLMGNKSAAHGTMIVPKPGDLNQYYIFTANGFSGSACTPARTGYYYHIVDMSQNGGLGSVTSKNHPLFTGVCPDAIPWGGSVIQEAMSGTVKSPGTCIESAEYWVIIPTCEDSFRSYLIDESGINDPIISVHPSAIDGAVNCWSEAAVSRNGKLYAISEFVSLGPPVVRVFDFDKNTGELLKPRVINIHRDEQATGLEFSPNNRFLYTCSGFYIDQYDLQAEDINASKVRIKTTTFPGKVYTMSLGVDDKIYVTHHDTSSLDIIENPNLKGVSCNYNEWGMPFPYKEERVGLQNIVPMSRLAYDTMNFNIGLTVEIDSCNGLVTFSDNECHFIADSTLAIWDYGDGAIDTFDFFEFPDHIYESSGEYYVSLSLSKDCYNSKSVKDTIDVFVPNKIPGIFTMGDSIAFGNQPILIEADKEGVSYQWAGNGDFSCDTCFVTTFLPVGDDDFVFVDIIDSGGCSYKDSIFVYRIDTTQKVTIFIPNAFTPNQKGINEQFKILNDISGFYEVSIYDRRGNLVFIDEGTSLSWNGLTKKGKVAAEGVYIYKIQGVINNKNILQTGSVEVIR